MKLRHVLTLCGLLGLVILVLFSRHEFESFVHLLTHLRWYIIAVVVVIQVGNYYVNALYYRSILKMFGYDLGTRRLFEGALATNFVNYVLPSVGLAGAGYLSQVLSPEVPRGEGVLTQLTRYALSALAVVVMLPVGFVLIVAGHDAGHAIVKVTLGAILGIIGLAIVILILIQYESKLRQIVAYFERLLRKVFPKSAVRDVDHFIDEFYVGYRTMTHHKRQMLVPFGWSIVYILIEVLTFYLAFVAFGKFVVPGIAIMAYLFANIVSIFGGVFFSTGTFEVGMAGTLVVLGVPLVLAISVTTVYRVLNLIIGLPPGFYFYKKYLPRR